MKLRCFRLRRKLLHFWRQFPLWRRRHYLRLHSPSHPHDFEVARKLVNWGRDLASKLHLPHYRCYQRLHEHPVPLGRPPKGHLAVYVGGEEHRFIVPVVYFNHPLFGDLLKCAERQFGFDHAGGITLPCPISDFESICARVATAVAGHTD